MKPPEIIKFIIESLEPDTDAGDIPGSLEKEGVSFDFIKDFRDKVTDRIFTAALTVNRELEFTRNMSLIFYRIAITGVAAIVLLMISIIIMQDSFSFNSFLGLGDSYDESIVCLLTGN